MKNVNKQMPSFEDFAAKKASSGKGESFRHIPH